MRKHRAITAALITGWGVIQAHSAEAHAAEQGFVLLLPTGYYSAAGTGVVLLTIVILARRRYKPLYSALVLCQLSPRGWPRFRIFTSILTFLLFLFLLWQGVFGPADPLRNLLPLVLWTLWWPLLPVAQGLFGNLWRWCNPWDGPLWLIRRMTGRRYGRKYPTNLGYSIGIISFLGFMGFLVVDPAPADPARLAMVVGLYWLAHLFGGLVFGPVWFRRAEGITMVLHLFAGVSMLGRARARLKLGLPGWRVTGRHAPPLGWAILALLMLGSGSFDGLNETFWWFGMIGINPLEFPGRSAVILPNFVGLLIANLLLLTIFAGVIRVGGTIAGRSGSFAPDFRRFALTVLPIALGYHIAHFLPGFLVEIQYVALALNDPFRTGANFLGLEGYYVTTGFFNTRDSVRLIWLTQAGAVVLGHVMAVLMAHDLAQGSGSAAGRNRWAEFPTAIFMVAYTVFGLWLLAAPRGL